MMGNRLRTGLLLATLWAGAAMAQTHGDGSPATPDCAAAEAALASAPPPNSALRRSVEVICGRGAAMPARDPENQRAREQWHRARRRAIGRQVDALMASQDARSQLAAALLRPMTDVEDRLRPLTATAAFAAARRLGDDDPLVAWMVVTACPIDDPTDDCDPQAALTRLQRLQPDNAAHWAIAAGRTLERGDPAAADRYLARAAQAPHYDLPLNEVAGLLYSPLLEAGGQPMGARVAATIGRNFGLAQPATIEDVAAVEAMAIVSAVAIPGFASLERLCLDEVSASQQRRAACTGLLSLMTQADSVLARSIGLGFMTRLTAGTPAGAQWRARQRELRWLRIRGFEAVQNAASSDYLRNLWRDGEVAALQAVLAAAGQPLTPPPGWVSPRAALAPAP